MVTRLKRYITYGIKIYLKPMIQTTLKLPKLIQDRGLRGLGCTVAESENSA